MLFKSTPPLSYSIDYGLVYSPAAISLEVIILLLFCGLQQSRLFLGSCGNKTETSSTMVQFILLTFPAIFAHVYFLRLQTYVLMVEVVLNAMGLVIMIFEFLFSLSAFKEFKRNEQNK